MGFGIHVVLVINCKGGSGKSTLRRALVSAAAAAGGKTVTIFDTDISKSCSKWMPAGQEAGNWSPLVEVIHTLAEELFQYLLALEAYLGSRSADGRMDNEGLLGVIAHKAPNRGLAAHIRNAVTEARELLDEIDRMILAPAEVA